MKNQATLAQVLKSKSQKITINDTLYNIVNSIIYTRKTYNFYTRFCFFSALAISFAPVEWPKFLYQPDWQTRLEVGGFLFTLLPLIALAYIYERLVRRHAKAKHRLSKIDTLTLYTALPFLFLLDTNIIDAHYTVLNATLFLSAGLLLMPLKRKQNYYTKKHLDKRTK